MVELRSGQRFKFVLADSVYKLHEVNNFVAYVSKDIVMIVWNKSDGNDEDGCIAYDKEIVKDNISNGDWIVVDKF